jgi:dienelactone hydrolase
MILHGDHRKNESASTGRPLIQSQVNILAATMTSVALGSNWPENSSRPILQTRVPGTPHSCRVKSPRMLTRFNLYLLAMVTPWFVSVGLATAQTEDQLAVIERRIPPAGNPLDAEVRQALEADIDRIQNKLEALPADPDRADIDVLLKAVTFAIELDEFYSPKDIDKAKSLLKLAKERTQQLQAQKRPWVDATGRVVRGYYSSIDGSPQPYVVEIPDSWDSTKPAPLYVWLHGRGDKTTDLHFIDQRLRSPGTIKVENALIVHPFGRHCIGFKSAGEIDVLEVVEDVKRRYKIDPDRVVLMGFSMGGAGVWHIGAHYTDRWVAMSPGAGFAETAEYNRLTPDRYPSEVEQTLWQVYDCPHYARNLLNLPLVAYSGEQDKQIQAALVMETALAQQGHSLNHVIGPGMGHKYHPDSLAAILSQMDEAVGKGLNRQPARISLQTPTLRYATMHGFGISGLQQHWLDSRLDVDYQDQSARIQTQNVNEFYITDTRPLDSVSIDGQHVDLDDDSRPLVFHLNGQQQWQAGSLPAEGLRKLPGLQGPIDDAWLRPFLVVKPTGTSIHPKVQAWVDFELDHLQDRWQALFRGRLPMKLDTEVTADDIANKNLILWGDPQSNLLLKRLMKQLPIQWDTQKVQVGTQEFTAGSHVPVMIYPNPEAPTHYIVVNSGPTFREGHDRTNSLQNPKLPDWAVIDLTSPPTDTQPGSIKASGFFDEQWRLKL